MPLRKRLWSPTESLFNSRMRQRWQRSPFPESEHQLAVMPCQYAAARIRPGKLQLPALLFSILFHPRHQRFVSRHRQA